MPDCKAAGGTLLLGEDDASYGKNRPDSMRNITVSNVICNSRRSVYVAGFLSDSVITNVVNKNPDCSTLTVARENGMKNVETCNPITKNQ